MCIFSSSWDRPGVLEPIFEKFDMGVGAAAPYTINYWRYHFGEIGADVNYYLNQ